MTQEIDPYEASKTYWSLPKHERSWKRVLQELGKGKSSSKADQNRLARMASEWEMRGLVSHVVAKTLPPAYVCQRAVDLEFALLSRFPLRDAIVVDCSQLKFSKVNRVLMHKSIGIWGARTLVSLLEPNISIGVVGGKACYHTIDAIDAVSRILTLRPRSVISLLGCRPPLDDPSERIDSDLVVSMLAAKLAAQSRSLMERPMVCDSTAEEKEQLLQRSSECKMALVGIGVLTENHFLYRNRKLKQFASVRDVVADIVDNVHKAPKYVIGELCHQFFLASPLDLAEGRAQLQMQIDRLNTRMLAPALGAIAGICERGSVIAVAVGKEKAPVVRHLLTRDQQFISHLVLDAETAGAIVGTTE